MKKYSYLVMVLLLSLGGPLKANGPTEGSDPVKVKNALQQVQTQMQKLEKKVYHDKKEEKLLNKQLANLDKEIGESSENLSILQAKMATHSKILSNLQNEQKQLKQATTAQQAALSQLLQATFQHYRKEKIQLLFEQQEWATLSRLNHYYQFFYNARAIKINELQNDLKQVQLLQDKIVSEKKRIENLSLKSQNDQKTLFEMKEKRKEVLASLSQQLATGQEQLSQLQQQEQHLEQLFKALQKTLSTTPTYIEPVQDFAKAKKQLQLPVQMDGAKLSSLPNLKTANPKKTYIHAETGTPVNAIFPGKVVFAEWLRGLGLLIIVDHGNGYMSLYGNNQKLYKGLGETVNQGEMIARVGQSGGHAEPGLYFEIRKDGEAVDPSQWFKTT